MLGQAIYRRATMPLFETVWHRRRTLTYWRELERSQWLPPATLRDLQLHALKNLLEHAYRTSPYYRMVWDAARLDPANVRTIDDLCRLPLLQRQDVIRSRDRIRNGSKLMSKTTGGTSGDPMVFDLNADSNDRREAAWHRGYTFAGAPPGCKQWHLWGVPRSAHPWARFKLRTFYRFHRRVLADAFALTDETATKLVASLNRCRPDAIVAYTGALYVFAQMVEQRSLRVHTPAAIIVGAEQLHPFQREVIERVFGAPVRETYGCREVMLIGAECERREGLHLTAEHLIVEIVDENGVTTPPGMEGNVIVTDLFNYGFPFIRYVTGDRALAGFGSCSCGRGLPLLSKVCGRQLDIVITPDGKRIPGELFPHMIKDYSAAVSRYQVVQETPWRLRVKVVRGAAWDERQRRSLLQELCAAVGPAMNVTVDVVDAIPLTKAGKMPVVINEVARRQRAEGREIHAY